MRIFIPVLLVLCVCFLLYNFSTIDFHGPLTSRYNQEVYTRMMTQLFVLIVLVISYNKLDTMDNSR